jgi:glycosyltransferase involved in cell wall biosynthesis
MRFSVDAHAIGRHLTGNEAYVRNLLNGFASLDQGSEFIAYLAVQGASQLIPPRFRTRMVSANPFLRLGFDISRRLREDMPDLVHVQYTAPLNCPVPVIVSVHDVSYLEHPEYFTRPRSMQLRYTVKRTIQKAARVLTLSDFSRKGIIRAYELDEEKVVVVPAACSPIFRPLPYRPAAAFVEGRFQVPGPFILTVGDLQPRKNHIALIRAFEELVANHPQLPHHLVLVGKDTWFAPRVHEVAEHSPFGNRIHFTGYVDDHELLQLYNACDMFVFPSLYEGFGIPILEAMACGRAVACSNSSAMPDVADSSALLFNPKSISEMTRAMRDLLLDHNLRSRVERLGQQNATRFSWEKTARKTLDVYYDVAGGREHSAKHRSRSVSVSRT